VGGFRVNAAQSNGECPGSSTTLREGRFAGASVDVESDEAEPGCGVPRNPVGGVRRSDAAEGGGLSELLVLGRGRREDDLTEGGGIREEAEGLGGGALVAVSACACGAFLSEELEEIEGAGLLSGFVARPDGN
jgi:hypothetical protein